jgi:putative flavoprotein involved in K+ transport
MPHYDTIIIGGGQSAMACAYYLNRANINYIILDDQEEAGGSWLHAWDSLTLFSPAEYSSLPGYMMAKTEHGFPQKQKVIDYLKTYETRYKFNIQRTVKVSSIEKSENGFNIFSKDLVFGARTVISATGTWQHPIIPVITGAKDFEGKQTHSGYYKNVTGYHDKKVLIVGGGNSGAQILAELSEVAHTSWATQHDPAFLPDDVDGRVLFHAATAKYHSMKEGKAFNAAQYSLGNIVMVPPLKHARDRGVLRSNGTISRLTKQGIIWGTGEEESFDEIIWCTGFGYATQHLASLLHLDGSGKCSTIKTKAEAIDGIWLVGYGSWTGFASATLIGVGRSARETVKEVEDFLAT